MNEAYFEKAYEKYKNLVIKYLIRKGVEITNIMHTIDSYVRDFYLDKFKAYECAAAIYDNIHNQVKTENYNGDDSMTLEEAMEIVTNHGFGVKKMDEAYGDAAGTQLSDIIEEFISGNNQTGISKAEQILAATGRIDQVKAEFIDAIKPCVGHGLSDKKFNEIKAILGKQKTFMSVLIYITGLMHSAQGNGINAGLRVKGKK